MARLDTSILPDDSTTRPPACKLYFKCCNRVTYRILLRITPHRPAPSTHLPHPIRTQCEEPIAYVQKQLGHSSIKLTVDTYCHWMPGKNREAMDRLPPLDSVDCWLEGRLSRDQTRDFF